MDSLASHNMKTARAYQIRLTLKEFFLQPTREAGEAFLERWYFWATHSRLEPVNQAAKTIKRHWEGILNWLESRITIGILEGFNNLIQAAKARARGYRQTVISSLWLISLPVNFNMIYPHESARNRKILKDE